MGNLITNENDKKQLSVFKLYDFFNFWFYGFCFIALGNLSTPFIELYFGKQFSLGALPVFMLFFAFYVDGLRGAVSTLREATGAFKTDKWFTIAAAIVNLAVSVIFVNFWGITGVYFGTICAMIVLHISRTLILFREQYNGKFGWYFIILIKHVLNGLVGYFLVYSACSLLDVYLERGFLSFLYKIIIVTVIPNTLWGVLYHKDERFIELKKRCLHRFKQKG